MQQEDSPSHHKVLRSLKRLQVPGYDILIEETKSRLDFPNALFQAERKGVAQRKRNLCYTDAIVHSKRVPRVLIEVVDNNPTSPSAITGLTVNVDRIAEVHPNIDLIFIVLAEMKDFYCKDCRAGHRLSNTKKLVCLGSCLGENADEEVFRALIHEGKAANFKKALIDYPISDYLRNISPPSVLFLNKTKVATAWEAYQNIALRLIEAEIGHIVSQGKRSETRLIAVSELIPQLIGVQSTVVRGQSVPPPPGSEVTWISGNRQYVVVLKNRGRHNTRIRFPDGHTEKVPNSQLSW